MSQYLLTIMTFAPALGALAVMLVPRGQNNLVKWISLAASAVPLALCWPLLKGFNPAIVGLGTDDSAHFVQYGFQFVTNIDWIGAIGDPVHIRYCVGVDGISITMV